jgi:hypothetical protein
MPDSSIITSNIKGFERNLTPSITVCQCELLQEFPLFLLVPLQGGNQINPPGPFLVSVLQ